MGNFCKISRELLSIKNKCLYDNFEKPFPLNGSQKYALIFSSVQCVRCRCYKNVSDTYWVFDNIDHQVALYRRHIKGRNVNQTAN